MACRGENVSMSPPWPSRLAKQKESRAPEKSCANTNELSPTNRQSPTLLSDDAECQSRSSISLTCFP